MTVEPIRYAAYGYPMAEQDINGAWVVAEPDSALTGEWGTLRIEVGATWNVGTATPVKTADGTDITTVNDVPTLVDSLQMGLPWTELTGQLTIPEVSPFDDLAAIGVVAGANVDIWRVLPAAEAVTAGVDEAPYWHGFISSIELADGHGIASAVSVQLLGAAFGETSMRLHQPVLLGTSVDIGTSLGRALDLRPGVYARPLNPFTQFYFATDTTGIETRHRGSRGQTTLDYAEEMLALAQDSDVQWTIRRDFEFGGYPVARKYVLAWKSEQLLGATQENTIFAGGYGVSLSLNQSYDSAFNAVYGEGVDPTDSSRWRNMKYPGLLGTQPAYPVRDTDPPTYPIVLNDTDVDFTADVITQAQAAMRQAGLPDVTVTGVWDADTITAYEILQADAGVTVTGEIADDDGWDLIWAGTGGGGGDVVAGYGYARPLSEVTESAYYLYGAAGQVLGDNDTGPTAYDGRIRCERIIGYGEVSKARATKHARRIARMANDGPVWSGTVTLLSDPTQEEGEEREARSRFDILPDGWLRVNNLPGGSYTDFAIVGVAVAPEAETVTLTVSQVAYDLLDLSTKLERDKAAREDPASSFYSYRNQPVRPLRQASGWDKEGGAGLINPVACAGSAWTTFPIIASEFGSIQSLAVDLDDAVPFCFAVFGGSVAGTALDALIPDPLAEDTDGYGWWSHPDNLAQLATWGHVESWGEFGEAAGFYPGYQSAPGTVAAGSATGRLEDAGSWTFASLPSARPFLWGAVYPQTAGTPTFSGEMRIAAEE
jgi:hypothetical protein